MDRPHIRLPNPGPLYVLIVCSLLGLLIAADVLRSKFARDAEVNAQTEVERTRIEEAAKLERTREMMNVVPWYNGGENKD